MRAWASGTLCGAVCKFGHRDAKGARQDRHFEDAFSTGEVRDTVCSTYSPGVDGSVDVCSGPEPPPAKEANWIRTLPDTGWFPMLRLYGPLEPWIEGTWHRDDLKPLG